MLKVYFEELHQTKNDKSKFFL